jgi:SAM-dependent methyltransferase
MGSNYVQPNLANAGSVANDFGEQALPLICPRCLRDCGREQRLSDCGRCPLCGVIYHRQEGIPILLADDGIRGTLNSAKSPSDARTRFYQDANDYLVERTNGREDLEYALCSSNVCGLILEIGTGKGTFKGFGGSAYCGIDYSLPYLRTYLKGYNRVCATAETLPFASESGRLIFSFATFEHVPRPDLAFAEVDRVLAVGGVACLNPAWHCRDWAADGLTVRPYSDLTSKQKIRKLLIPLRDSLIYRGIQQIPWRIWRRSLTKARGTPSQLHYKRLRANYEHFWVADSDACASIDSHEGILFFESRGYEILRPPGRLFARLLTRAGAVIARKRHSIPRS